MSKKTPKKEKKTNRETVFVKYWTILKTQFPDLPDDIIEDAAFGALLKLNAGKEPSSITLAAAYDLDIVPTQAGIVEYLYKDRTPDNDNT
jgi:hypothetical protein